jgi:hypothetical protein
MTARYQLPDNVRFGRNGFTVYGNDSAEILFMGIAERNHEVKTVIEQHLVKGIMRRKIPCPGNEHSIYHNEQQRHKDEKYPSVHRALLRTATK